MDSYVGEDSRLNSNRTLEFDITTNTSAITTECDNLPLHQEQGKSFDRWRQTRKRLRIGISEMPVHSLNSKDFSLWLNTAVAHMSSGDFLYYNRGNTFENLKKVQNLVS